MLRRLGKPAHELIMQHLLAKGELLAACRFTRHQRLINYPARPLLAAAAASGSKETFNSVFSFFQQRNEVSHGSPAFLPEEGCDDFVRMWTDDVEAMRAAAAEQPEPVFAASPPPAAVVAMDPPVAEEPEADEAEVR